MLKDPYAAGALDPDHHARLVADLENYARDANVKPVHICRPLPDTFGEAEREYIRRFKHHVHEKTLSGVVYVGEPEDIEGHFSAFAGCLVRNFVRARVMTVGMVLDALADGSMPDLTALLIPNFFQPRGEGGGIAPWQVHALFDMMVQRDLLGQQTIVAVPDIDKLGKEYGVPMAGMLKSKYLAVKCEGAKHVDW